MLGQLYLEHISDVLPTLLLRGKGTLPVSIEDSVATRLCLEESICCTLGPAVWQSGQETSTVKGCSLIKQPSRASDLLSPRTLLQKAGHISACCPVL
jgi:hypothetical protein